MVALIVLQDIPSIEHLLEDVSRTLVPRGRFVSGLPHSGLWSQNPTEDPETEERHGKVR